MSDSLGSAPPAGGGTPAPAAPAPSAPAGAPAPAAARVNPLRQPEAVPASPSAAPAPGPEIIAEPTPASPTYKVKVDGKLKEVSLEELQRGFIAQETWTQRSQRLAQERKALEAQQNQWKHQQQTQSAQMQQIQRLLTSPQDLYRHLTLLAQQTGWTPDGPDAMAQPVSAGQMQLQLNQRLQQIEQTYNQKLNNVTTQWERQQRAREVSANKAVFDRFVDGFIKENAALADAYEIEDFKTAIRQEAGNAVRYAAESGQPVEDWADYSLQQLKVAAERRLEKVKPLFANRDKLAAASTPAGPQLNTQPSGGKPVTAQPRGTLRPGSPEMRAAVRQFFEQQGS